MNRLEFGLLGPFAVSADGVPLPARGAKQNALLGFLVLHRGETVSADRLIDALWGERPPRSAKSAVQGYVAHWRRLLEPGRVRGAAARVLVTHGSGYMLDVPADAVDVHRFQSLLSAGQEALRQDRPLEAVERLGAALALWRGRALAEFAYESWAEREADRLHELRLVCREDSIEAELRLGRHSALVADLEALVAEHPLRERLRSSATSASMRSARRANVSSRSTCDVRSATT